MRRGPYRASSSRPRIRSFRVIARLAPGLCPDTPSSPTSNGTSNWARQGSSLENDTATEYPWGVVEYAERITHETNDRNPANTSVVGEYTISVRLPERVLEFQGVIDFQSDRENFHLVYTRRLHRDGELIREKTWRETFARDSQ